MIWLIIAVVGLVLTILITKAEDYDKTETFGFLSLIFVFIPLATGTILGLAFQNHAKDQVDTSPLAALNDGTSIQGRFFLGSGVIDSKPTYYYYKEVGENSYQYKQLVDDGTNGSVTVVEDTQDKPYIKTTCEDYEPANDWWRLSWFASDYCDITSIEFHIPTGSISKDYKLDLKQ